MSGYLEVVKVAEALCTLNTTNLLHTNRDKPSLGSVCLAAESRLQLPAAGHGVLRSVIMCHLGRPHPKELRPAATLHRCFALGWPEPWGECEWDDFSARHGSLHFLRGTSSALPRAIKGMRLATQCTTPTQIPSPAPLDTPSQVSSTVMHRMWSTSLRFKPRRCILEQLEPRPWPRLVKVTGWAVGQLPPQEAPAHV